jgi:putative thioredoxin
MPPPFSCRQRGMKDLYFCIMSTDVTDFSKEVLERSRHLPVLVDFWAPWCGPCKMLAPVIEKLASQAQGRWELAKVNTEVHPELAEEYGISSIPNVKLFHQGQVIDEFLGALPEIEMVRWLEQALPSPHAPKIEEAVRLLEKGQTESAAQILLPILESEPKNDQVRVLLAQTLLTSQPERIEALLDLITADSDQADLAQALRFLANLETRAEEPEGWPEASVRARFLEGIGHLKSGDYAGAVEALIDVLGRDRQYAEGVAKEACKSIFLLLGLRHPVSEKYHRAFANALYA